MKTYGLEVFGGSINIGNGNFIVDSDGNMTAKNGRFEGTVAANKIEGYLVEGVSADAVNRTRWYNSPATSARVDYIFRKTDPRAARFICDAILLDSYNKSFSTSLAVYINGQLAKGYRTDRLSSTDGVEHSPWHFYAAAGSNLLGCPSFDLPAGEVLIELKLYSWVSSYSANFSVRSPDTISGLFIYK